MQDPADPPRIAVLPLDDVLLPGTRRVRLPDETKDAIREAVKEVAREGRRTAYKDDVAQLIASIEDALTLYLMMRGRWTRGPYGAMPPSNARDSKAAPTRKEYIDPLKKIATALKNISAALNDLPTDGIANIEDGADAWLWFHARIEDEYPKPFNVDRTPDKTTSTITDDKPLRRYRFLLRLEALKHGVAYARGRADAETKTGRPKDSDTPRLVGDIADAYQRYLGRAPTSSGENKDTPVMRVLRATFDWLGEQRGESRLSDSRLHELLIKNGPKRV